MEEQAKLAALAKAARALNAAGVTWAVGASAMLYLEGVVTTFNDIDLIIADEDLPAAQAAMLSTGAAALPPAPPVSAYRSVFFSEYQLDGVDFDLLSGFTVHRGDAAYRYPFGKNRVAGVTETLGAPVPLCALADWYVLYLLMPGRSHKARLIADYLTVHPQIERSAWLNTWLTERLPGDVREQVLRLNGKCLFD